MNGHYSHQKPLHSPFAYHDCRSPRWHPAVPAASSGQRLGSKRPSEPQPQHQRLTGMIQPKPGSHNQPAPRFLLAWRPTCVTRVRWCGEHRGWQRILHGSGELGWVLLLVNNIVNSLDSFWLCMDEGCASQKELGMPLQAGTEVGLDPATLVLVPFLILLHSKPACPHLSSTFYIGLKSHRSLRGH